MDYSTLWQNNISNSCAVNEQLENSLCAEKTDQQLIEIVLAGEKAAFEEIFERYIRLVASVAGYYFRRPDQIEEIIQITFTKVYFELKNFNGKHEFSFAGWLKRITANACLDTIRKHKCKPENLSCELSDIEIETVFTDIHSDKKTVEDFLVEKDLTEKLLSHIPAEDRAILLMFYEEGMNISEIAEITGWSCSKIKIRTFRSRKTLRKLLKKYL
jgi:RNA polymerase sigma-70 factor, ECF subfamily